MTIEEAKTLKHRERLIHTPSRTRWFVSGRVQTWKRNPDRIRIPIKHGLYAHDAITEYNVSVFEREDNQ